MAIYAGHIDDLIIELHHKQCSLPYVRLGEYTFIGFHSLSGHNYALGCLEIMPENRKRCFSIPFIMMKYNAAAHSRSPPKTAK